MKKVGNQTYRIENPVTILETACQLHSDWRKTQNENKPKHT